VILPTAFREELGESFYITMGFNRCAQVMSVDEFDRLREQIRQLPADKALSLQYLLISPAKLVSPNATGRIMIPQKLREDAGLSGEGSMFSTVLVGVVNMLTTVIALLIIDKVGRKQLVWWGVGGMIVCLLCIGTWFAVGTMPTWFLLTFFLLYVFCTAISISAVVFVLLSEMYPNRVRGLAMSVAGLALWVGTYLIGQLTPWMLETLTPAGTFFLFAFMCLPYLFIMWKWVPETTGKSLEEIEAYWRR
jgi:division/cell wall cluster transcriptional repressor MraZ